MDLKKVLGILVILVLVITAFGCKKETPLTPEEKASPATEVRQQTIEIEKDVLSWGKTGLRLVSELKCDLQGETGIFSFKMSNPTDKTYTMRKVPALETAINPLKIKVNGRVFDYNYCRDGDGDVMTLEPGAMRICTREFVAKDVTAGDFIIRTGISKLGTPVENRLLVQSGDFVSEVLFKCD